MKKLIYKILIFTLIIFSIIVGVILYYNKKVSLNAYYELPQNTRVLFVGSSLSSCGIRDFLITDSKNMALGGESYFYTYMKLKKLLEANPQIEYVFIDFMNRRVTQSSEHLRFTDMYLESQFIRYNHLATSKQTREILEHNFLGYLSVQSTSLREKVYFMKRPYKNYPDALYWGGNDFFEGSKLDSLIRSGDADLSKYNDVSTIGSDEIEYLQEIVNLCKSMRKNLVFMRIPSSEENPYRNNEETFQSLKNKYFSEITFLDFDKLPLSRDAYLDLDHLNNKGAENFSHFLNSIVKDSLWIVSDKQEYIDRKIAEIQ